MAGSIRKHKKNNLSDSLVMWLCSSHCHYDHSVVTLYVVFKINSEKWSVKMLFLYPSLLPSQFPAACIISDEQRYLSIDMAACTNLPCSSSLEQLDHNTRAPCSFIRCLNNELIITVKLALYECSGTHRVLDKQMNHRQLDLGAPATKSTREPTEMFIFMRS